jgi:hypothetical protein
MDLTHCNARWGSIIARTGCRLLSGLADQADLLFFFANPADVP